MKPNYGVYYKASFVRLDEFNLPNEIEGDYFVRHWVKMRTVQADNLEEVYTVMQGENWSPNGEMRDAVLQSGTGHTSMSVGDIINSPDGKFWMVDHIGFKEISLTN